VGRRARVELVLEDDRRGLAVDPGTIPVSLGPSRGTTRSAPFHRPQASLGKVAGEALVAERDRQVGSEQRPQGGCPVSGQGRLPPFVAGGFERQADDQLPYSMEHRERAKRGGVGRDLAPARQGREWSGAMGAVLGQRHADPSLPEVDPEQGAHGPLGLGEAVALGDAPELGEAAELGDAVDGPSVPAVGPVTMTSTRDSIVGIVVTQSGQTVTSAGP